MLALILGSCVYTSPAQQAQPAKEKQAYLRLWNMLPIKPANNLLVLAGEQSLSWIAPMDVYTDYFAAPLGSYNLAIKRPDEKQPPLQRIPVVLEDGMYITLLTTEKGGQVTFQLINDTPDPKVTDAVASLIVRSFFTGGHVAVGVAGSQAPQSVPDGASITLDNLPMIASVHITVQVAMPTTPPTSKSLDIPVDFSVTHHATLLLVPDQYARLVPKLFYNGRLAHPVASRNDRH